MNAVEGLRPTPDNPPSTVDLLHGAYHAGLSLSEMAPLPGVTLHVAERYGLYTATEPQDPGSFREYRKAQRLERIMDTLADRVEERFRDVPEFEESFRNGTFPLALASTFDAIMRAHGEGVNLKNERIVDGRKDGDIFIGETTFPVEPGSTRLLNTVLTRLLHKNIPKDPKHRPDVHHPITYPNEKDATIKITDVSEHDIRAAGRSVEASVWRWFRRNENVRLPANKTSFIGWQEWGHTFPYPSEVVNFMQGVTIKYFDTPATATYHHDYNEYNLRPVSRLRGPLGTDASGVFQRWRNIINGLGHHLREGGSAHNLEQNPNRHDRISLEEGIELRRELITQEEADHGPGSPRVLTNVEAAAQAIEQKIEEAKLDKFGTLIKATKALMSFGLIDTGLSLLAKLPKGMDFTRELSTDAAEYRTQQLAVKASRETLKHIVWKEVMGPRFRELDAARATAGKITITATPGMPQSRSQGQIPQHAPNE